MTRFATLGLAMACLLACDAAGAAGAVELVAPPQNVLVLSAEAGVEVPQDLLTITLQVVREGRDAAAVQSQLRQALDAALAEARKAVRLGRLDVRTGQFSLYPRYSPTPPQAGIVGWQGQAELVIDGRDLVAISELAGRLPGMTVSRVAFGLSVEARERASAAASTEAIGRFKAQAKDYAAQFGFAGYSLREVTVGGGEAPMLLAQPMMQRARVAGAEAAELQPVAPGKAVVHVSVSGSVQMSPR